MNYHCLSELGLQNQKVKQTTGTHPKLQSFKHTKRDLALQIKIYRIVSVGKDFEDHRVQLLTKHH